MSAGSIDQKILLEELRGQREHVFEALDALPTDDLRRPVLPSGWSCLGLVNHLALDDEQFWFQAVIAGDRGVIDDVLASTVSAWNVSSDESADDVLQRYRDNIERSDQVIAASLLDAEPAWWPDLFGSWHLGTVREVLLHVITETATHAGHLDAARELLDGKQHLVLTDS